MNKLLYIIILLCCAAISCNPPVQPMKFTGITHTNDFGRVIGTADTTDWGCTDNWTDKEKKLFKHSFARDCKPVNYKAMFYPNPCRKKSILYLVKDKDVRVALRLVDKEMNVILSIDSVYQSTRVFNLSSIKNDDTLRLYYMFITPQKCEYRGHGDIFVNPYK